MSRIEQFMAEGSQSPESPSTSSDAQLFSERVQTAQSPEDLLSTLRDVRDEAARARASSAQSGVQPGPPKPVEGRPTRTGQPDDEKPVNTPEAVDVLIGKAVAEGTFQGLKVAGERTVEGVRQLGVIDPESGEVVWLGPGKIGETRNLYYVEDIPAGTPAGPGGVPPATPDRRGDAAWIEHNYVERLLRNYESSEDLIDGSILQSLDATLRQQMSNALPPAFRREMLTRVHARIKYHNASIKVQFALDEAGGDIISIYGHEHAEIFNTPGVREVVDQILNDDVGIFFRLGASSPEAAARRAAYLTTLTNPPPGGLDLSPEDAERAFDLAIKTFHIFGESAYYDGIKVATGVTYNDAAGNPIPMSSDGFVSREVLEGLYPGMHRDEQMALFLEQHWNDILFADEPGRTRSLSGQGAHNARRVMYWPVLLNIPGQQDNPGDAPGMRPYAYMWVNSAVDFDSPTQAHQADITYFTSVTNDVQWGGRTGRMRGWAPRITTASKNRGIMNEKGNQSVLNVPLINPNEVITEDASHAVPKVLENYKKTEEAFSHLAIEDRKRAMAHLLEGVLRYVNSQEARTPPNNWLGWNSAILDAAISHVLYSKIITSDQAEEVMHDLHVSLLAASAQIAGPEVGKGLLGGLQKFYAAVTKR